MFNKVNRIFVTGDVHSDYMNVIKKVQGLNLQDDDIIIVCGDFGANYDYFKCNRLKITCRNAGGQWIILRGNHDSRYWRDFQNEKGWSISEDNQYLTQDEYPNIHYVKDEGGIYHIGKYCFLMIPGAYSVDKEYRLKNNLPYEKEEQLTEQEITKISNLIPKYQDEIDFVIAHTFPQKIVNEKLTNLFLTEIDQKKVDSTMEKWIDDIMYYVEDGTNFKHYFGGHYHGDKDLNDNYTILYREIADIDLYAVSREEALQKSNLEKRRERIHRIIKE